VNAIAPLGLDHVTVPVGAADPAEIAVLAGHTSGAGVTEGSTVEFTGGWLRFTPGEGEAELGFGYADAGEFGHARDWLSEQGKLAGQQPADRSELADPDGNRVEISAAQPPSGLPGPRLLHAGVLSADVRGAVEFYQASLGLRISDWIADSACFLRCRNGFHHSLAIVATAAQSRLDHVCLLYDDFDLLMQSRARVRAAGIAIESDLLKHAPSGSVSFYYRLPGSGLTLEHCIGHERVDFETREPRRLPAAPETRDMWQLGVPAAARTITGGPLAAIAVE
jgi:catechol 2,3-dioxygenase-like lactoylglutathione lyase family enzyme